VSEVQEAVEEGEPKRLQIGERGADGRVYLGYAIVGRKIIHSSVSSIKKFDPRYDGCQRRWFYQYREGKKEDKTAAQTGGSKYGKQLEDYLKTGVDKMQPVLLAVKHYFPKPGPDLEVEQELGSDIGRAIALRTLLVQSQLTDTREAEAEIKRCAGLVLAGVPITGAPDVRHRRGEYIDESGQLRREAPGMRVVSIDDLKTTKRINDHTTRGGKLLQGWALTAEEVVADTQMVGYGVHASDLYPDTTHVRLAHNYAQTENGFCGARRMGLVTVEYLRRRWDEHDAPVMREMIDVAAEEDAQKVPFNTKACKSFGRDCPHLSYCQPERTLNDVFDFNCLSGKGETMSNGLFDDLAAAPSTNGVSHPPASSGSLGLFGPQTQEPPPIPPPIMGDEERQRQIEEAKAKLRKHPLEGAEEHGYRVGQPCNGHGFYQSSTRQAFIAVEAGHKCPACATAMPAVPTVGAVNPLDAPPFDPVAAQKPLPPEEIAKISDAEIRGRAEAIAKAAQERAALEAQAAGTTEKKSSGFCSASGTTILLTDKQKVTRKLKCPGDGCDKEHKIKDKDFTQDLSSMVVPKHRVRGSELAATTPPAVPPPPAVAQAPAVPPPIPPPAMTGEMTSMVNEMFGTPAAPPQPAPSPPSAQPPALPLSVAPEPPKSWLKDSQAIALLTSIDASLKKLIELQEIKSK
jgi:hypothetical protein